MNQGLGSGSQTHFHLCGKWALNLVSSSDSLSHSSVYFPSVEPNTSLKQALSVKCLWQSAWQL